MPKPGWYNIVRSGQGSGLTPRGREGTVTPRMQSSWLTHGAIAHPQRPHRLRRKRKFKGRLQVPVLNTLRTPFEMVEPDRSVLLMEDVSSRTQVRQDGIERMRAAGLLLATEELGALPSWLVEASRRNTKRTQKLGRPYGPKGGIPPQPSSDIAPPSTPERRRGEPLSRPKLPAYPPEVRAMVRQGKLSKALARHPANWQTTSPGKPVPPPEHLKPKPGGGEVSQAAMYQHVVRAVYNRGLRTGYKWKKSPARSAQEIAREKMIKWKYASKAKSRGGGPDRRRIKLTNKGTARSKKHSREPAGVLAGKAADFAHIVGQDPL